jgi:hypothetical protein
MKAIARIAGPVLFLLFVTACGTMADGTARPPHTGAAGCATGGERCRWDGQCCSGRCYVDTGCVG